MSKKFSIGEVAERAQITVRTLHHYDQIDLLKPSVRSDNGYRYYTDKDIQRLDDILLYRALGFSLKQVGEIIVSAPEQRMSILATQAEWVDTHINRLLAVKEKLSAALQLGGNMKDNTAFNALKGFDPDAYEPEVSQKWGNSNAYKESARRTKHYSQDDWKRYKQEADGLINELAALYKKGSLPDSDEATDIAEKMRCQIDTWFYPCSKEMHAQLGDMYVADPRFTATYDKVEQGLAVFLNQSIKANLARDE